MRGRRNVHPTTEQIGVFLTEDERRELGHWTRLAKRHTDCSMTDLGRVALLRLLRTSRNQGSRWLAEQIQLSKEGAASENGTNDAVLDLSSNNRTITYRIASE